MAREPTPDFDRLAETISPAQLARALEIEKDGGSWHCPLPGNHENGDKEPSFSVYRRDGRTGARCHGGDCNLKGSPVTVASVVWGVDAPEAARRLARSIGMTPATNGRREIETTYDYVTKDGDLLFQVVRLTPKGFRQRAPDGANGWNWSTQGVRKVLYRLPDVLEAVQAGDRIFVVEGERDADALAELGFCATCNPGGAGKWRDSYTRTLAGARVGIIADRDEPGRDHAWSVARELEDVAEKVVVLEPAYGSDVSDHLGAGLALSDLEVVDEPPEESSGDSGDADSQPWRDPLTLGPEPPADLPSDVLPSPLREHVESVAGFTQTPTGLPLTVGLAAVSTAIAGKAEIEVRRGWREPLNLYLAAVLDPANRKSPVEREMAAPIREFEREGARELGPEQRKALDLEEALEKRRTRAQKAVANADSPEEEGQALSDLEDARQRIEDLEIPTPPRLLTDDVTPEALGRIMADSSGRAGIISSEGDVLRIFAGRYSSTGDPTLDIIKKAWSGDPVRVDRVGRDGVHLPRPLLTVGLTVQPTLLRTLGNRDVLAGEGVLARFLWMAPPSLIGNRLTGANVPAPDEAARERYEELLESLLDLEPKDVDETGEWEPHVLDLAPDARDLLYSWESEVEALLADGGELAPIRSWGGKVVGTTVRLAGVLHVVARVGRGERPFTVPVTGEAMQRAIRLARAFVPHARHVLAGEVGMDEGVRLARYVLRRIREADADDLTERDLWQLTRGKAEINEVADLRDVLARLEAHHLARRIERPSEGPGRKPSPWVRLNPRARENIPKIPTIGHPTDQEGYSGDSGDVDPPGGSETEGSVEAEPPEAAAGPVTTPAPGGPEIIGDDAPADPDDVGAF